MKIESLAGCVSHRALENVSRTGADTGDYSAFAYRPDEPFVVALGLGVNSVALLVGLWRAGVRPDLILFADTGSERPETYAYIPVLNAWLARIGFPSITIVRRNSPKVGDTSLHGECLRKSILPSPAYGGKSCSIKWKVDPQCQFVRKLYGWKSRRQTFAHGPTITKLVGYDAGPADTIRIKRSKDTWPKGHVNRYPLNLAGWDRERCAAEIRAAGLPVPVKSACFMCPNSKRHEVEALAVEHPDLADICVQMEERAIARGLLTTKGLGRRWAWSEILLGKEKAGAAPRVCTGCD